MEDKEINEIFMYMKMNKGRKLLVTVNVSAPQTQEKEDNENVPEWMWVDALNHMKWRIKSW